MVDRVRPYVGGKAESVAAGKPGEQGSIRTRVTGGRVPSSVIFATTMWSGTWRTVRRRHMPITPPVSKVDPTYVGAFGVVDLEAGRRALGLIKGAIA